MDDFPRLTQTFGRIGAGFVVFASMIWLLWDGAVWPLDAEPMVAVLVSLFVWLSTEFKKSDEIVFRASAPNDVRVAKLMLGYSAFQLRELLLNHDFRNAFLKDYFQEFSALCTDCENKLVKFQRLRLRGPFADFHYQLAKLVSLMATHTTPGRHSPNLLYVYDPSFHQGAIKPFHLAEIEELNVQATHCWNTFLRMMEIIHEEVPEAFDDEIKKVWKYV